MGTPQVVDVAHDLDGPQDVENPLPLSLGTAMPV